MKSLSHYLCMLNLLIAEYGMGGDASKEGDVYSFRIFVVELFTGKRPTDKMFGDNFNLHNFVKMTKCQKN
jgi:hypothetical protein